MNEASSENILIWMSWLHLAFLAVPLLLFIARLEWIDLQEQYPDVFRRFHFKSQQPIGAGPQFAH